MLTSREELNSLQAQLDKAQASRRQLEAQLKTQTQTAEDLAQANQLLSAKTLDLADKAGKGSGNNEAVARLEAELKEARQKANKAQEDADEEMARGQTQRIQLLDEVSQLSIQGIKFRELTCSSIHCRRKWESCANSSERPRAAECSAGMDNRGDII
jgi:chromosome segregation ATPase